MIFSSDDTWDSEPEPNYFPKMPLASDYPNPKTDKPSPDLHSTPFKLPADWTIEVRPRANSSKHSDTYYHEPGTGRKFRSLLSVKRHLNGEDDPPPRRTPNKESSPRKKQSKESSPRKKQSNGLSPLDPHRDSGTLKKVIYGGKVVSLDGLEAVHDTPLEDIHSETLRAKSASTLPDGWLVKDVPRKLGSKIKSDRYYIDPATGKRFRSIPEVHRFLEGKIYEPESKASPMSGCSTAPRSPLPKRKNTSFKMSNDSVVDLKNPPERVNWVYSGDGKDNWSPIVEECMIPNYIEEQWSETFLLGMIRGKHCNSQSNGEQFEMMGSDANK